MDAVSEMFFEELDALHEVVARYKDEEVQALAASLVPLEVLQSRVRTQDPSPETERDLLLQELIEWFRNEFFVWQDAPRCTTCKIPTHNKGLVEPTLEESRDLADKVESYYCSICSRNYRFPRYNCPRKLLETRTGRCGEWANAFTLFCIALEYDARFIYDVTDHVWTEVYSESQGRWLHCDPCEGEIDKPLMYESGWGKKLTYVMAFSLYETADVTWRYVKDFMDTLRYRTAVDELDLIYYQDIRSKQYQDRLSHQKKFSLAKRRVIELTEFLSEPKANACYGGRTSGNLSWRLARNEIQAKKVITNKNPDVKELQLMYFSSKDEYVLRENGREISVESGWATMMNANFNVHRKIERDWRMSYIARVPGVESGTFRYHFEVSKPCSSIDLCFRTDTFANGKIVVNVIADGETICVKKNEMSISLAKAKQITIACEMTGGMGESAWQHAQAFRQSLDDYSPSLKILLRF